MAFMEAKFETIRVLPNFDRLMSAVSSFWDTPFEQRSRRISEQVAALRALSDVELAARGLRRDEILQHVFGRKHA